MGAQIASPLPSLLSPKLDNSADAALPQIENEIKLERYEEAISKLRPLVQTHPTSWRVHYDLGYALFRERKGTESLQANLRDSIREISRSLQLNEGDADAHKILGLDLLMIQREDLAGSEFREAVRLAPSSAEDHYFLGRYLMQQGKYSMAASELRRATELDPSYMKAFENLGIALERMGSTDEALVDLKRAVEMDQKDVLHSEEPYVELARFYQNHGNLAAALPLSLKAVDLNPRSEEALLRLALLYRAEEDWGHALDVLQKAEKLHPTGASTQYLLGRTYKAAGDIPRSQQAFSNFERLRKSSGPDPNSLGEERPQ